MQTSPRLTLPREALTYWPLNAVGAAVGPNVEPRASNLGKSLDSMGNTKLRDVRHLSLLMPQWKCTFPRIRL